MTGLLVKHVGTKKRRMNILQNAVTVGSHFKIGTPKPHEARSVPCPAFLDMEIAALMKDKAADEVLFGDGTHYMPHPRTRTGWFDRAVQRCIAADKERSDKAVKRGDTPPPIMPRVRPHDLRHTAASLAISSGANVEAIQRMLGHASAPMTLDTYADLFDDDLDDVATALNEARATSLVVKPLSGDEDAE